MIIAREIKIRLPDESSRLEQLALGFSDFKNQNTYVAEVEYQALMDAEGIEDGKSLDNGIARVFDLNKLRLQHGSAPKTIDFRGQLYSYSDDGPGVDIHDSVHHPDVPGIEAHVLEAGEEAIAEQKEIMLPYFREDIHKKYIEFKSELKKAADDLIAKIVQVFLGDSYRGIYLFASYVSIGEPPIYVPSFTFSKKSGDWDYVLEFPDGNSGITNLKLPENPWAFDWELSDRILAEMAESHKDSRFVHWAPGKEHTPTRIKVGNYDVVYFGIDGETYYDTLGLAPSLAKAGGLVVTRTMRTVHDLLHNYRSMKPFFTAESYVSEDQFLLKTK